MLDVRFTWRRGATTLTIDCTLDAPVTGVFGPSGAGKSSVLAVISGLACPEDGYVAVDGDVLCDTRQRIFRPPRSRRIGMMFQEPLLFPHYDVRGNLRYGWRPDHAIAWDEVVDLLVLQRLLDRRIDQLSGGERQRVALGRALLSGPRLLLLDEPLASLDAGLKRQILPFLRAVNRQLRIPMVYVSHDISEILQLTRDVVVLDGGRVVSQGPFHAVMGDRRTFELTRHLGFENIMAVRVAAHVDDEGLTRLELIDGGATVWGPPSRGPLGAERFIAVNPADIAVARSPIAGTSIRNQLAGQVTQLFDHDGVTLLEVDVGSRLLVEISRRSAGELGLEPGADVICLFKASGVRYVDAAPGA